MAYIDLTNYQSLINDYADARQQTLSAIDYLETAVQTVVDLDVLEPELDLLRPFYDTYLLASDTWGSTTTYNAAVRALQNHIINRSDYDDVDDWLNAQSISYRVPYYWAELSEAAGFPYSAGNIAPQP